MNVSYMAHISGNVQGVFFRVSSQQKAIDYGLSGYARNLADGNIEVVICGEQANVDKMLAWLKKGPPQAEVEDMQQKKIALQDFNHFSIS
ncbi:MAG: acylphosphatase [Colwellia sp.]